MAAGGETWGSLPEEMSEQLCPDTPRSQLLGTAEPGAFTACASHRNSRELL